jgi:glycosyltransferase involved in cell wall biosynthesis
VREEDVDVVHLGVRHVFRKLEDRAPVESFLAAAGLRRPYVLYVGNIKLHKNVPTLLRAFALVRRKLGDVMLAFAGGAWSQDVALVSLAHELGIAGSVKDLHHLSDEELVCAYNGADVLALPSLYEGFGLPVLEAMACSTPTVVSAGGSLPEIAGNASVIVDPCGPESLAEALSEVISDPEKKRDLVAKGRINLQRFSWRSAGSKTLAVYEKVLKRCENA